MDWKSLPGKFAALLAAGLASVSFSAFAETSTVPAAGVSRVQFKLPGELLIRYGTQEMLTVEAEAKVMPKLDIAVKGESLVLASKQGFKTDKNLKFTLTIRSLQSVRSEGSGNVLVENFSGRSIDIDAAGTGNLRLKDIKPNRLTISIDGTGSVDAFGSGESAVVRIAGSGNIDTTNFRARSVEAEISGSGEIKVHADDKLKAMISGAGNIEYQGKAKVTQSVTGAGSVDRI